MYWRCLFLFFGFVGSNLFCFLLSIWVGIGFALLAHPYLVFLCKKSATTFGGCSAFRLYPSSAVVFLLGSGLASLCSPIPVWGEKWNVEAENWICCVSCCLLRFLCKKSVTTFGGVCDWFCFMCLCRSFFSGGIGFALLAHPWLGLLGKKSANTWQCLWLILFYTSSAS